MKSQESVKTRLEDLRTTVESNIAILRTGEEYYAEIAYQNILQYRKEMRALEWVLADEEENDILEF